MEASLLLLEKSENFVRQPASQSLLQKKIWIFHHYYTSLNLVGLETKVPPFYLRLMRKNQINRKFSAEKSFKNLSLIEPSKC